MVMKITNRSSIHRFKFCVDFFFLVQYSDAAFGDSDIVSLIWHFGGIIFFGRFPLWGGVSQSNRLVWHFGYWLSHCNQADAVPPSGTVLGFRVWKRNILDQNKFLKSKINIFAVGHLNSFLATKLQKLVCRELCIETNIKYLTVPPCSVEVYNWKWFIPKPLFPSF
jgi:hypothetical protein